MVKFLAVTGHLSSWTLKGNLTLKNAPEGCIMVAQDRISFRTGGCYQSLDCTVKPVPKATCIRQSPAFKGHYFRSHLRQKWKSTCIKQPVFGFPIGACLTQI